MPRAYIRYPKAGHMKYAEAVAEGGIILYSHPYIAEGNEPDAAHRKVVAWLEANGWQYDPRCNPKRVAV